MNPIKEPEKIEIYSKFLTPSRETWVKGTTDPNRSKKAKMKFVVKNVAGSVFAKVQNLVNLVSHGKWVNNKSVLREIEIDIDTLNKNIDKLEAKELIAPAISAMKAVCERLRASGVKDETIDTLESKLDELTIGSVIKKALEAQKPKAKAEMEEISIKEKFQPGKKKPAPSPKHSHVKMGKHKEPKSEFEAQKSDAYVQRNNVYRKFNEKHGQLRSELASLISNAYTYSPPKEPHKSVLIMSLGQYMGTSSTENQFLDKIRKELNEKIPTHTLENVVDDVIKLIEKGFNQAIERKLLEKHPSEITNFINNIKELKSETRELYDEYIRLDEKALMMEVTKDLRRTHKPKGKVELEQSSIVQQESPKKKHDITG